MNKILCHFGFHNYVMTRVLRKGVTANLMGHECSRCGAIPDSQKGL